MTLYAGDISCCPILTNLLPGVYLVEILFLTVTTVKMYIQTLPDC